MLLWCQVRSGSIALLVYLVHRCRYCVKVVVVRLVQVVVEFQWDV